MTKYITGVTKHWGDRYVRTYFGKNYASITVDIDMYYYCEPDIEEDGLVIPLAAIEYRFLEDHGFDTKEEANFALNVAKQILKAPGERDIFCPYHYCCGNVIEHTF